MNLALAVVDEVMSKHPTYKTHDQILNHILNRIGHDDELTALLNEAIKLRLLSVNDKDITNLPIPQNHISTTVSVNTEHSNINIEPINITSTVDTGLETQCPGTDKGTVATAPDSERAAPTTLDVSLNSLPPRVGLELSVNDTKEFEARPYQLEYIEQCSKLFLEDGCDRCLVKAPTGSGKNYMIMSILNKLLSVEKPDKSVLVVCLSPRIDITNQIIRPEYLAIIKQYQFVPLIMHSDVSHSKSCEEYTRTRHENKNILISGTYQSVTRIMDMIDKTPSTSIDFLIMDEAHYLVNQNVETTEKNTKLQNIAFLSTHVKRRLFVTATPYENQETNDAIYGPLVSIVSVGQLIRLGYLAKLESSMCRISENTDITGSKYEFTDKAKGLQDFMITNKRQKCIVFVNSKENGYNLQKLIQDRKYTEFKVVTYFGEDSRQVLEDFQTYNEPIVIITCKRINMGVDVPAVDSIVFADPRLSKWDISQCIGRGLRKVGNKNCHCLLYDNEDHNQMIMNYLNYVANECEYLIVKKDIKKTTATDSQRKHSKNTSKGKLYNGVIDVRLELITNFNKNIMPEIGNVQSEFICKACNTTFTLFKSLKEHIINKKCKHIPIQKPISEQKQIKHNKIKTVSSVQITTIPKKQAKNRISQAKLARILSQNKCKKCGNSYLHKSSLSRHKSTCQGIFKATSIQ